MFFYNEPGDNASPPSNPPGGDDPTTPIVGWTRTTLYDPNITSNISFGKSVDASSDGEFIVAGAPNHRVNNLAKQGRAYVFQKGANNSWDTHYELVPTDRHPSGYDYFGESVAISDDGNIIVVGAIKGFETPDGAAYVFEKTGAFEWTQIDKLKLSTGQYSDSNVGFAEKAIYISHDNNMITVGAPYNNNSNGSFHSWLRAGSGQPYTAVYSTPTSTYGKLGVALQVSPDNSMLIAGIPTSDSDSNYGIYAQGGNSSVNDAGNIALYTFNSNTSEWEYFMDTSYQLWEYDTAQAIGNYYGTSVAISNISLVASAIGADSTNANETGRVIVQDIPLNDGQSLNAKVITLPEEYSFENDFFGNVVDVTTDGQTVFVAAYGKSSSDLSTFGAAYAFQKNATTGEWDNIGAFLSDNPTTNAQFGNAMAASRDGNVVAVGEKLNSVQTTQAGAVHIFLKTS